MQPQTQKLMELVSIAEDQRDEAWEKDFFNTFAQSKVSVQEEPVNGPDGWPYLIANTEESANESVPKILDWLSDKGIGLALNVEKGTPDYVFTYGMIWNYKQTGQFVANYDAEEWDKSFDYEEGQRIVAGEPTEEFWPSYARHVFREFLKDQNIESAKILLMAPEGVDQYDLCFSLDSLGNPPESEHEGILEAFSWFFPLHYSLALVEEEGLPQFTGL